MVSESVYLILHWITLGITLSFGLGFLYFHIPPAEGLRPYRLCRYAMACAYLSLSVIDLFGPLLRTEANSLYLMQYVTLVISSLHAFLFTFTLVTLIDPLFLTWRRVAYELLPVVLLISLSGAMLFYEIPALFVVVSWCFTGYYICQLIRYLYLFFRHYKA
ncbi:MAG: hypothetical protein LBN37_05785, partial [Bacteroidales bacterium]|nr:hypothetical protein [Bacteroidales bacterium]